MQSEVQEYARPLREQGEHVNQLWEHINEIEDLAENLIETIKSLKNKFCNDGNEPYPELFIDTQIHEELDELHRAIADISDVESNIHYVPKNI